MKRFKILICLIISVVLLGGCGKNKDIAGEKLYVYNWGEYIDESILKDFEKETGIKVIYETFTQNEDMYMRIKEGGSNYDVVVPSDYMIERMISEDMLMEMDMSKLSNFKNIGEDYLNMEYDPEQKYSVPYFWGTVGILYNKKMVKEKPESWSVLWDKKYKDNIIMMDSTRDSIGIALIKDGYSMNSRNMKELEQAKNDLIEQKKIVMAYLVDEIKSQMVNEEAALAPVYTGDAIVAMNENENLDYVIPKEGSNIWFDAMVIPKEAKNVENAYKFIDYVLRPEVSAKIAEYVEYSTPNTEAYKLLENDLNFKEVAYPDLSQYPNLEVFKNPSDYNKVFTDIWAEVKAAR
ncbi:ABC transporter substrate-binding protein [Mediannikoviicoccus vaginalis]|uniref:ABC transporter substrate-binding protein n=1 Tax=Mediannikoviicoccus vaginalis TaxID=2899727 RepID=UPI001F40F91C|nr:spermidine/putrescine ABC transporter substrate-binding protein [Mediannikoviicoccus vaginalis]